MKQTVRTRMAEYRAKTAPIIPYYEERGLVRRVNGMAPVDDVRRGDRRNPRRRNLDSIQRHKAEGWTSVLGRMIFTPCFAPLRRLRAGRGG